MAMMPSNTTINYEKIMRIREARMYQKMTQKDLAEMLGVDVAVISRYENGTVSPSIERIAKIADILSVSVDYLIGRTDNENPPVEVCSFEPVDTDLSIKNSWFVKLALNLANGYCELCGKKASSSDLAADSYLEIHCVRPMSAGGTASLGNLVALCPNCHKRIHVLHDSNDLQRLKAIAYSHTNGYQDDSQTGASVSCG